MSCLSSQSKYIFFELSKELSLKQTLKFSGVCKEVYRKIRYKVPSKVNLKEGYGISSYYPCLRKEKLIKNKQRYLPFTNALADSKIEVVKIFLKAGINVKGISLLHLAIFQEKKVELVKLLLKKCNNLDLNETNHDNYTPLMEASLFGQYKICTLLLEYGASIDFFNERMNTALIIAATNNYYLVVNVLIKSGATIDMQNCLGRTALTQACVNGYIKIAELLWQNGANPHIRDNDGYSAIEWAYKRNYRNLVKKLHW